VRGVSLFKPLRPAYKRFGFGLSIRKKEVTREPMVILCSVAMAPQRKKCVKWTYHFKMPIEAS